MKKEKAKKAVTPKISEFKRRAKSDASDELTKLFDLATGYQRAKVLFALLEFEIPTLLAKKPRTSEKIAAKLKIERIAADRLLNAGAALEILIKRKDVFAVDPAHERYLVKDSPAYLGAQFLRYDESSYPLWNDLTDKIKDWRQGATASETPEEDDQGGAALAEQHNLALLVGDQLAGAFNFANFKTLLDLGGGTGAMAISICRCYKKLSAVVFDLPQIAKTARKFIKKADLSDRIAARGGNFQTDDLPESFDVALLANFMSVADETANRKLLKKIHEKLPRGGAVILSGWILDDAADNPTVPVLFCLEDICREAADVERTAKTYQKWLRDAGFKKIRHEKYFHPTSMIVGYKR